MIGPPKRQYMFATFVTDFRRTPCYSLKAYLKKAAENYAITSVNLERTMDISEKSSASSG
jgi:hypothetical protein